MQTFMDKGKVNMVVNIEGDGLIVGLYDSINITKVEGYGQLERLGADYLEQQMSESIGRIQKRFGMDVFGFGEQLYRKHYAQYITLAGNWNEIFANIPVKVKAKIKLRRSELKTNQIVNEGVGP
ncbi:MAG TPA: Ger(x)C family spore germination C-terminal domain-containing protein [Candidatus Udaeobacter sp.]|nr:Ger(x)C family spore germination C-terminal domain-containing protein [Candidatus Udaeobacter sp.]